MAKYIIIIVVTIIPFFAQAQSKTANTDVTIPSKHKIGISAGFGGYDGLSGELYYQRRLHEKDFLRASVFSNSNYRNGIKLGWRRELIKYKRLTLGSGLDLKFTNYDYSVFSKLKGKNLSLVLPLELDIRLTNRLSLNLEYNYHLKSIRDSNFKYYDYESLDPLNKRKVSVNYRF